MIYQELSNKVLKCAFTVHHGLGAGLLESVYEGGMCIELGEAGLHFEQQKVYPVSYKGKPVGRYIADLVVENTIILELKAVPRICPVHEAQLLNYLKLSGLPVGYLFNFNNICLERRRFVNT
ncbi:MAG: GxxExxY protein [Spirochaetales bacterium]|nr:GxxExxY protein [Spirochaetales bacterium]